MKIALVCTSFPDLSHNYIWAWLRELIRLGVDITVLTEKFSQSSRADPYFSDEDLWRRIRVFNTALRLPAGKNWGSTLSAALNPHTWQRMRQALLAQPEKPITRLRKTYEYLPVSQGRFDLVHFNYPKIAARRLELGRYFGARTLVSFRGQDLTFYPGLFAQVFERADHLHFISCHLLEQARQQGYRGNKHTLIAPMVDTAFYTPHSTAKKNTPGEPWLFFSSARLYWTKGWEYALKAVALLVEKGWNIHYAIAGDGDVHPTLAYTIRDLNLSNRIRLLGWLTPQEVRNWMQKADLYLLASVEEGFNNSVLQAQSCGLPAVVSDAGGLPESIVDGSTGYIFERRNAWDMAEKIEHLLNHPGLLRSMSQHSRQRVLEEFSLSRGAGLFKDLYTSLIQ